MAVLRYGDLLEKTSHFLLTALSSYPDKYLTIGELLECLKRRSYGALLVMLSIAGLIPGISFFAGIANFLLGLQIAIGFQSPRLPYAIQKRTIHREKTLGFIQEVIPWLERTEIYVKPRWASLSGSTLRRIIGMIVCILSVIAILPLPFINFLPNIAIVCLALGIIERDGLFLLIGATIAAVAMWISHIMVRMAWSSLIAAL